MYFKVSAHALDKHLDYNRVNTSVFFDEDTLYQCVYQCLKYPEHRIKNGDRFEAMKTFPYPIGYAKCGRETNDTVKVVFKKTKKSIYVITAYPIYS